MIARGCVRSGAQKIKPLAAEPLQERETHPLENIKCLPSAKVTAIMMSPVEEVEYLAELTTKKRGRKSCLPVFNF